LDDAHIATPVGDRAGDLRKDRGPDDAGLLEVDMRNPWLAKNPFMSAWMSAANQVAGTARGHATAAANRQLASVQADATRQVVDFWTGQWLVSPAPARKRKKR
jgi:hypothetical protein